MRCEKSLFLQKIPTMKRCFILFGSNQGNREAVFDEAYHRIINRCGQLIGISSFYESEPWGFEDDTWFLNRLIVIETMLRPDELMDRLLGIEAELGRVRHPEAIGYSSRLIDLDILYYGSRVTITEHVTSPHPLLHLRRFALMPLCEVAPKFKHPVLKLTQTELLACCPDTSKVIKRSNNS